MRETVCLRYPDGELVPSLDLRRDLTRLIRRFKPEVVITGDPTAWFYGQDYVNHPDHRAAAEAAIHAVFPSAGTRMIFTELLGEGLEPHNVRRLYVHGNEKPDTWVDISETLDLKIQALKKHFSQSDTHDAERMIREWAQEEGKAGSLPYAEVISCDDAAQGRRQPTRVGRISTARSASVGRDVLEAKALDLDERLITAVADGADAPRDLCARHVGGDAKQGVEFLAGEGATRPGLAGRPEDPFPPP